MVKIRVWEHSEVSSGHDMASELRAVVTHTNPEQDRDREHFNIGRGRTHDSPSPTHENKGRTIRSWRGREDEKD